VNLPSSPVQSPTASSSPAPDLTRRVFLGGITGAALSTFLSGRSLAQDEAIIGHGLHRYTVDAQWAARNIDARQFPILNCHEMVRDSRGRLLMLGDHVGNNVLIFDEEGRLLESWGTEYPGGHGLSIARTRQGEECLWIVDCGWYWKNDKWNRQRGRVVQTDLTGRLLLDIGHPATYGAYEPEMNYMPTETAVGPDGTLYIADGYGSDYVLRFDAAGRYLGKFGGAKPTEDVPESALKNAHGIAVDMRDATNPTLVVTSRSENCFKRFTLDGKYLSTIPLPGAYVCRPVIEGEFLYAGVCWSKDPTTGKRAAQSGFTVVLDRSDRVVSAPGGTEPRYEAGKLQALSQAPEKVFQHGHDVCPDSRGNLIVCQWNAGKTYPVRLVKV
jgi:hypothetical protein